VSISQARWRGACVSMLFAILGLTGATAANAIGSMAWYIHLHSHNPWVVGSQRDVDFYGTRSYSNLADALAALKKLDPANLYGGEPILQINSVGSMSAQYATFKVTAPTVAPSWVPYYNYTWSTPHNVLDLHEWVLVPKAVGRRSAAPHHLPSPLRPKRSLMRKQPAGSKSSRGSLRGRTCRSCRGCVFN
jgi:hypothetical protein